MTDFWSILDDHAGTTPDTVALDDGADVIRYRDLPDRIGERVETLLGRGSRRVALDLDNGSDWIMWDLACARAGVVCVPLPPFFLPTQKQHAMDAAGVDTVVTTGGPGSRIPASRPRLPAGTAKITFTSGSTGTPKGVCLPWPGLVKVAASILEAIDTGQLRRHYSAMPLGILLENVAGVYAALLAGASIAAPPLAATWQNPMELVHGLDSTGADSVILVPEMLRGMLAVLDVTGKRLEKLRFVAVGGSTVAASLVVAARDRGLPVYEGYGLSECGSVVCLNRPGMDRPGTAGAFLPHVRGSVTDGELVIEEPIYLGYLGERADGPLATGDLVEIDSDGFVSIRGRARNLLVTSWGRNLSPEWIEAELLSHPEIRQTMVYGDGLPQPRALIAAAEETSDAAITRVIDSVNRTLPQYARLEHWRRVPAFTVSSGALTGNGRLRRSIITDSIQAEGDPSHD